MASRKLLFIQRFVLSTGLAVSGCGGSGATGVWSSTPDRSVESEAVVGTYGGAVVASETATAEGYYGAPPQAQIHVEALPPAGLLTAATVGDSDRRDNYLEYLTRHAREASMLRLDMMRRVRFNVVDHDGRPMPGAVVSVLGAAVGRTHADGVWDFFPRISAIQAGGAVPVTVSAQGTEVTVDVDVPESGDGADVVVRMPGIAELPRELDLAFAIDVTGSMEDELRYVNREIADIVARVRVHAPQVRIRVGATLYRDRGDENALQVLPFTDDAGTFAATLQGFRAYGGGDYPEDMNAGLETALHRLSWSQSPNAAHVLVLIADAPPHNYTDANFNYHQAMSEAAERGIRILPVAASGADRVTEYLMRAMGSFTSTPYAYLTDDSGIGGSHMDADTDRVGVEQFNQMLVRLLLADLRGEGMHEPGAFGPRAGQ